MKLYEDLPRSIVFNGRKYRLNLDFRNVLRMIDTLGIADLLPEARAYRALKCVMRKPPKDADRMLDALKTMLFPKQGGGEAGKERLTDYAQDADYIRAAFRQCYGIDLYRDKLHWFEFQALIAGLPEGCKYMDIIGIRARPLLKPTKYNHDEREWIMKAKLAYALDKSDAERERSYSAGVQNIFLGLMGIANRGETNGGTAKHSG